MRLQLNVEYPSVQIHYQWPQLDMQRHEGTVTITSSGPELEIDNKAVWEDLGYGDHRYIARQGAEQGRAAVMDGIAQWSADGDRYVREMDAGTYARIISDRLARDGVELNVRCAPRVRPQIDVVFDQNIQGQPGTMEIRVRTEPPDIQWQMGRVNTNVEGLRGMYMDRKG